MTGHACHDVCAVDDPIRLNSKTVEKARELGVSHSRRAKGVHSYAPQARRGRVLRRDLIEKRPTQVSTETYYQVKEP